MPRSTLLALLALSSLAGCGGDGGAVVAQRSQAPCPRVTLLADAADLTRYRAAAPADPRSVEVNARITGLQTRCDHAPRNAGLDVTLVVQVAAERSLATAGQAFDLPYLIAVTEGEGRVLNRGTDTLRVTFPNGERRATAQGEEMMVRIPGDVRRAAEKAILVGFQLTPEQLAANRRRGPL